MDTYPRPSGECSIFRIPPSIAEGRSLGLAYLRENNIPIVKGDLVIFESTAGYRNDGYMIFDGVKLKHLAYEPIDYGSPPRCFTPIEDGAPIDYWHKNAGAIQHNTIIWVHSRTVKVGVNGKFPEVQYQQIDGKYRIFLNFVHNNKTYFLIFLCTDEDYDLINEDTDAYTDEECAKERMKEFENNIRKSKGVLPVYLSDPATCNDVKENTIYYCKFR